MNEKNNVGVRQYLASIFDGMAKGLFASLIVGVIIKQVGTIFGIAAVQNIGQAAQYCMGSAIGAGVAYARKSKQFSSLAAIAAGALGAGTLKMGAAGWVVGVGEPVGAFVAALAAIEIARFVEGRTKFDLLIIPAVVIAVGGAVSIFISPVIAEGLKQVGLAVVQITEMQPIIMGILLGIVVGMILTLPISSAALCIAIDIGGAEGASVAAGAALAGCCAQMVGFAVMSYRENGLGGLISQGLGTSMIQVPNIIKNPLIWIPPTVASGVCGFLAAVVFKMTATSVGAGMGTSGLVGPFTTYAVMGNSSLIFMGIVFFAVPAVISLALCELMRKKEWIKPGDLTV